MILSAGISNEYFYDGFEDGSTDGWVGNISLSASQTEVYYGDYTAYMDVNNSDSSEYVQNEISSAGIQPSQISFAFKDRDIDDAYGCAVRLGNSSPGVEASFMSNNPQWEYQDLNGITQIDSGVYEWTHVTIDFDWDAGTFSGTFEQVENGSTTASFSGDLVAGIDIALIEITNYSGGQFDSFSGNYMDAYFDEFEVIE